MIARAAARGLLAAALLILSVPGAVSADASGLTACQQLAARGPQGGHVKPPPAPALFPNDFPVLHDCEWGFRMGGYGGIRRHAPLRHLPVIFVHGNHVDAANWYPVTDQFLAAGYTDQELYAVSYNGLGSADDVGSCCVSQRELAYWQRPDTTANYASGGVALKDDPNAPDVYAFVRAVQDYTGSKRIEIVAHSFGVTVVRKMLFEHPELYRQVTAAVMIAGGNHGTSLCRGPLEHQYYGCEEVTPGSAWLDRLNSRGEAPGPTHWMTIYNGHDSVDPFFLRGADYDDLQSPHLDGAVNRMYPQTWHNDLRVLPEIVHTYMRFLLRYGAVA